MSTENSSSFYYFAYGTYVDPAGMAAALSAIPGTSVPSVIRSSPAILPGYRLICNAVSVESPRLGCLNITPYTLVARDPGVSGGAGAPSVRPLDSKHNSDAAADSLTAFRNGVRGMLYELPVSLREFLLRAVAAEGSFNMYAALTCYELQDLETGVRAQDAASHEALVIAALDLPLMERRFFLEETVRLQWSMLPLPLKAMVPVGLTTGFTRPLSASADPDRSSPSTTVTAVAVPRRWPGLHWCNCVNSNRVAPSPAYAAAIAQGYREYLHLAAALEKPQQEGNAEETMLTCSGSHGGSMSYAQAIHHLVHARIRDTTSDSLEDTTWYLAYGSNLSWEQVCLRIGPPYQRRAVKLRDYVLVPNKGTRGLPEAYATFGYYNIESVARRAEKVAQGLVHHRRTMPDYVCGAAYQISLAQLAMMDHYERGYTRALLRCTDLQEATATALECWAYLADDTNEDALPSKEYLSRVLEGADILPLEYMEGIRTTPTNPLRSPRQDKRLRKEL